MDSCRTPHRTSHPTGPARCSSEAVGAAPPDTRGVRRRVLGLTLDGPQPALLRPFGADDQRTAFTAERMNPRQSFQGHKFAHRGTRCSAPASTVTRCGRTSPHRFFLAMDGVTVREIDPVKDDGQTWAGLQARFPPEIASHSTLQESTSETITYCVDTTTGSTWREGHPPCKT